jgi:hypothetical protein
VERDIPAEALTRLAAEVADRVAGPLLAAADGEALAAALVAAAEADAAVGGSRAESLAARAASLAPDPLTRADADRCVARLSNWRGNAARAAALAEDASAAASLSARPADEYEATVEAYDVAPVDGVPFDAVFDQGVGMFVRFDGEPWFLHVLTDGPGGTPGQWDKALSVEVASAVAARR